MTYCRNMRDIRQMILESRERRRKMYELRESEKAVYEDKPETSQDGIAQENDAGSPVPAE